MPISVIINAIHYYHFPLLGKDQEQIRRSLIRFFTRDDDFASANETGFYSVPILNVWPLVNSQQVMLECHKGLSG